MFAVISLGGKQYRVQKGEYLTVDRLAHEPGSTFSPPVLLASSDADVLIDADALAKVTVTARVDEHLLGPKIRVFQYKPKKSTKKARGHRSRLSRITIQDIAVGSATKKASAAKAAPEKEPAEKASATKAAAEKAPTAKAAEKAPTAKAKAEKAPAAKAAPRKAPAKPRAKPKPATDEPATEQEA